MIPFELKIFSIIYECGRWMTPVLAFAWFFYALLLMIRLNRRFWLWLLIWPCLIGPMQIGFTWCGFHYRMELRDRYARTGSGWTDDFSRGPVDISKMPPEVRAEYAKHNYHPRARDLTAQTVACIVLLPVVYFFGMIGWGITAAIRNLIETYRKRGEEP